jgi:hypothetical protein
VNTVRQEPQTISLRTVSVSRIAWPTPALCPKRLPMSHYGLSADNRTDDGAFGADDVVYLGSSSENYVFR